MRHLDLSLAFGTPPVDLIQIIYFCVDLVACSPIKRICSSATAAYMPIFLGICR
jgi:hypothetical protein